MTPATGRDHARRRLVRVGWVPVVLAITSCDALLTDPAPPPASVDVQFQLEGAAAGGPAAAFARVRRVAVRFVRPDSAFRDTVFAVTPVDGRIRIPVVLEVDERIEALGIGARLGVGDATLFEGAAIVRIEPGVPTSAAIPVTPVPGAVRGHPNPAHIPSVGDTLRLASAVLFATLDTIPDLVGTWLSEDPSIVSVTPDGLATAVALGQTRLEVRYDTFADTVVAGTAPVDTIEVTPAAVTLAVGESLALAAVLRDAAGNVLLGRSVTWASADPSIAAVDNSGSIGAEGVGAIDGTLITAPTSRFDTSGRGSS